MHYNFKDIHGLTQCLRLAGYRVNEKRVHQFVRLMGYEPAHPKPHLTVPH